MKPNPTGVKASLSVKIKVTRKDGTVEYRTVQRSATEEDIKAFKRMQKVKNG